MTASPPNSIPGDPPRAAFPSDDALCEACGYPIKGLHPAGHCPECGSAIADSHPGRRIGPVFEHRRGPIGYMQTAFAVIRRPRRTFRTMRADGSNAHARRFLMVNAILSALLWLVCAYGLPTGRAGWLQPFTDLLRGRSLGLLWLGGVFFAVPILTYIEVLGVTWFSRRRGWRVPLHLAERVACYASVGWLPGSALLGGTIYAAWSGRLQDMMLAVLSNLFNIAAGPFVNDAAWVLVFFVGVLCMLGFETLVWVGVRRVKFANPHHDTTTHPTRH